MLNTQNSKLLIKTFDGSLLNLKIKPKCLNSTIEFDIKYYDYDGDESLIKAKIIFREVVSIDFEINFFDNFIGAELFGFYEIFNIEKKKEMIEKVFKARLDGYLYHGDYDYDANEENDILNYCEPINKMFENLEKYRLYQQQTQGGIYYILAGGYDIVTK
ncbi:hypothetical protein V6615_10150 [Oscillospiraceae bacterium PP1C4]